MLTPVQPHELSTYVPTELCAADFQVWGAMLPHAANLSRNFGGYAFPMSAASYRFGTLAAFASRAAVQAARFCGIAAVFMSTFLQVSAVYHS
jgi:hypothetical protein